MELRKNRILAIEDDAQIGRFLQALLSVAGYKVHVEPTGEAGLNYASDRVPDLVILDLRLPDMDGYDVCRKLRQFFSPWEVPIVMLTGMDKPVDQLRGFAHGADAYMTKPFEAQALLEKIKSLLGAAKK